MLPASRMNPHIVRAWTVKASVLSAALAVAACSSSSQKEGSTATEAERSDVSARLEAATQLIGQFRPQIPDDVANRAECVMVLPGVKKGGLVVGGVGGSGFATCASGGSWSPPAPIKIGGGTLGAQIGFQSADVLALMTSERAVKSLEGGNFKVGVDASAAAGPVGAGRSTSGDVTVKSDVVSYSQASGLFAGATLNGTTVTPDDDATRALYGPGVDLAAILQRRATLPALPGAQRFVAAIGASFPPNAVSKIERGSEVTEGAHGQP
jgi:SH3 domain-containing YSC84-like protein 1